MVDRTAPGAEARSLLLREYHGVLSTHSVDAPGYPFGSIVPYCLDRRGCPVILISRIAQHTKNIQADPKLSLIVTEGEMDDVQAAARLTYLANARRLPDTDEDTPARYYNYFPMARDYHRTHEFDFYRLELVRARYIGGFGRIYWLEPDQLLMANPFSHDEEQGMITHMNKDHVEATVHYCETAGFAVADDCRPGMAGIDGEGFHLRLGTRIIRFEFDSLVSSPLDVRTKLVAMAHTEQISTRIAT